MICRLFSLCLLVIMAGSCGQGSGDPTGGGGGGGEDLSVISGSLTAAEGHFGIAGKISASQVIAGYKIISQALNTGRIYLITTDAEGEFSFTVPQDDSYTFHILDDRYHYVAPIVLSEYDPEANQVPSGMEADADNIELGLVVLSEDENVAVLAEDSAITIDDDMMAAAIAGIPAGAAVQGEFTGYYDGCALDPDGDGVISIMDSDDDGDGILDEFDEDWTPEFSSEVLHHIGMGTNFHNNLNEFGNPPIELSDDQYVITVEGIAEADRENMITGIIVDGPDYLNQFDIEPSEVLATNWEEYNDKALIEVYLNGVSEERWGAFISGVNAAHIWDVVTPGDVWIFEITYNSGATEYTELAAKKINFVFQDTPRNVTIDGAEWTSYPIYDLPDTIVIRWDIIDPYPGMTYFVTGWPMIEGNSQYGQMFMLEAGVDVDSLVFIFADSVDSHPITGYNIDVVAQNANGDNAKTDGGWISKNSES